MPAHAYGPEANADARGGEMSTVYPVDNPGAEALLHHLQTGHFVGSGFAYGERAECFKCRIVWTKSLASPDIDDEKQAMAEEAR